MLNRLQALRAVAAYMVVLFHVFESLGSGALGIPRLPVGSAGVDLFFVTSGFIMVYVAGARETAPRFLVNRIARIVPLYWVATFAVVGLAAFKPWLFPTANLDLPSILASLTFIPHHDAAGQLTPVLFLGWTLNCEMLFYVLFAVSMLVPARFRMAMLIAMIATAFGAGLAAADGSAASFYGTPILFEFVFGCLIGAGMRSPVAGPMLKGLPGWVLIAGGAALLIATSFLSVSSWLRPIVWGVPAAIIVLGVVVLDLAKAPVRIPFLMALGDASYSAYLLHPLVFAFTGPALRSLLGETYPMAALFLLSAVGGTMVVSLLSYRFFEVPSRNLVRALFRRAAGGRASAPSPGQ